MSMRRALAERLFNISKSSTQAIRNCRISSPDVQRRYGQSGTKASNSIAPDPGDNGSGMFRRFLHRAAASPPEIRNLPAGRELIEKLREMDFAKGRIRLDGLSSPLDEKRELGNEPGMTADEVRKLIRVAQMEMVKTKLRETGKFSIAYSDLVRICGEGSSDPEEGLRIAKSLDESGSVVVIGDVVILRPEQVAQVVGGLIPLPGARSLNDPRRTELQELEAQKAEMDRRADALVRRELWLGLGYLVVQTAGFMRLTFWELSWDVMEPICFYVTSMYFMAGYAFFLRTSKDPSFEGFYQSRFSAKQKRLMERESFDVGRYNELRKLLYSDTLPSDLGSAVSLAGPFYRPGKPAAAAAAAAEL